MTGYKYSCFFLQNERSQSSGGNMLVHSARWELSDVIFTLLSSDLKKIIYVNHGASQ